jgi:hypothetical protein
MSPEGTVHSYIEWARWAAILAAVAVVIRLALRFWGFRGVWKIAPNATVTISASPRSAWASTSTAKSNAPGVVVQSGPFRLSAKSATSSIHLVAPSAADIPKDILDALTPEQRKLVLDRLPRAAQDGAAGSGSSEPKKR